MKNIKLNCIAMLLLLLTYNACITAGAHQINETEQENEEQDEDIFYEQLPALTVPELKNLLEKTSDEGVQLINECCRSIPNFSLDRDSPDCLIASNNRISAIIAELRKKSGSNIN